MADVLCVGHVNWDVTLRVDALPGPDGEAAIADQLQAGGGSAANTAAGLAGLDVDAALVGSIGGDENGMLLKRELSAAGVDCDPIRVVADGATTVKYLVVDEDGQVMVLANDGVNESFAATAVDDEQFRAVDHLHLTGQAPETAATLAERGSDAGVTVSFDPGRRVCDRDYRETAAYVDYLFLNGRERDCTRGSELVALAGATVSKRGDDGAKLRGDDACSHPGYAVDAVDTTGAGDAFAAGFLAAVLDGREYTDALAVGNACGALASREIGARIPLSWGEIERFRADH